MLSARRFVGYGMTGGVAAVIDLGLFLVFVGLGMAVPLAATASFLVAAVFNFTSSSLLVFKTPVTGRRFLRFLSVASVGLAINVGVTWLVYEAIAIPALAKAIGIGTAFAFNFVAHSLLVFSPRKQTDGTPD
jgi:putative flippase GtrA